MTHTAWGFPGFCQDVKVGLEGPAVGEQTPPRRASLATDHQDILGLPCGPTLEQTSFWMNLFHEKLM